MKILVTTMPKTGTHLLKQIVGKHIWAPQIKGLTYINLLKSCGIVSSPKINYETGTSLEKYLSRFFIQNDNIVISHLPYHPVLESAIKESSVKFIQLIRDPRDTIVSHYYASCRKDRPQNYFNFYFNDGLRLSEKDDPLLWAIKCSPDWWAGWTPWIQNNIPDMIIRYEDLLGPSQRTTIETLAHLVGDNFSVEDAVNRVDPTKSMTFRKGLVGEWKKEFQPHHIEYFNSIMKPTMEILGYDS